LLVLTMSNAPSRHVAVLLDEVVQWLDPQPGQVIIDGTVGGGGHARALAQRIVPGGRVVGLDRDPSALRRIQADAGDLPIETAWANFGDLAEVLDQLRLSTVDAVLLDLGLSSDQLSDAERGFSFDSNGVLDLRFDTTEGEPAWQLLERLDETDLANLIYEFGEERMSRRIARRIVERRQSQPIRTAAELAQVVRSCMPRRAGGDRIDAATRTFQALRIAVNDELKALDTVLRMIPDYLRPGGRAAIISFHSLEDRRVKEAFRDDPRYRPLVRKPVRPSEIEVQRNPRSRSAKLRVAERI
jgi:16S rRNA (cytosine1402-N4)-methyltransferase